MTSGGERILVSHGLEVGQGTGQPVGVHQAVALMSSNTAKGTNSMQRRTYPGVMEMLYEAPLVRAPRKDTDSSIALKLCLCVRASQGLSV